MSKLKLWLFTALAGIGLILSAAEQDRYELRFQKSVAPAGGAGEVGRLRFDSELYDAVGDLKAELRFYDGQGEGSAVPGAQGGHGAGTPEHVR